MFIPAFICIITNALIYRHVLASSRRVQTSTACPDNQYACAISRRDISLLRHMIILFLVFILGWTPSVIVNIAEYYTAVSNLLYDVSFLSFQLALLVVIIDLFLYNHEVRKYLIGLPLCFCRN